MTDERIKVLYISGWGRSGSTILSSILGQADGFFPVGEIRFIWQRNLIENMLCGCSKPFLECEVWREIFSCAYGGFGRVNGERMALLCERLSRTRHIPRILFNRVRTKENTDAAEYLSNIDRLYRSIQSTTNCNVIVDSSKYPSYARILNLIENLDLYIVHLVRDSRAVSFSWSKKKKQPNLNHDDYMIRFSPFQSSMIWNSWNVLTELFWRRNPSRYLFLCYEDFIASPQQSIQRILRFVTGEEGNLPFLDKNTILISPGHTLSGNPVRFQKGVLSLSLDDEWRKKSKKTDNLITTFLTWPLLLKYRNCSHHPGRGAER
jgi:hypothetical protein